MTLRLIDFIDKLKNINTYLNLYIEGNSVWNGPVCQIPKYYYNYIIDNIYIDKYDLFIEIMEN